MPSRFLSEIPDEYKSGTAPMGSATGRGGWGMASFGGRSGGFRQASASGVSYSAGERVRHAKFGVGQVVEAADGKVVVRFGAQERTFVPEMAPLSKE
jgi:DNA helicase-2/ATP-dependent DNA helicase PcrA